VWPMGRDSRLKRSEVIHRSKLFGGVRTAEDVHARHGLRDPCAIKGCPNLPVIQIKMFMLHDEFVQRNPRMATMIALSNPNGKYIPCTPTTFGPMVRFSTVNACRTHQRDAERAAAKAPSYVLVEIDRGPGADKPIVQVATDIARS